MTKSYSDHAVQCNSTQITNYSFLADYSPACHSFSEDHSLSTSDRCSTPSSANTPSNAPLMYTASKSPPTSSCNIERSYQASAISISDLESLGITKESYLDSAPLAILNDESEVYAIMNKSNPGNTIATLKIRPNGTLEIMTNGNLFSLIDVSAKSFFLTSTISSTIPQSFYTPKPLSNRIIDTITIPELDALGILEANIDSHCSIRDDGTKDYLIMKANEVIATLSIHPNHTVEIIKNGKVYTVVNFSGKPITLASFTRSQSSPTPAKTTLSTPKSSPLKRPPSSCHYRCYWCDLFGHEISHCQQLVEDIRLGKIHITDDGIINASTGHRLPLAVGRGGMRSFL